jgi:ubiquitin carboxyl-terminal hydrolase 10
MNSILQPLIHCPPFYNYFDDLAKSGRPTGNLVKALIDFLGEFKYDLQADEDSPVSQNIFDVLYHLKKFDTQKVIIHSIMSKGSQEDAEEFLGFLLDGLEEELLSLNPHIPADKNDWTEIGPNRKPVVVQKASNDSPISLLFGGSMRSVVKASGNKDSVTIQPFQSLQLDITVSIFTRLIKAFARQ